MKKIISFILIAILCLGVLTSCEQINGAFDTVKDWLGIEKPAEGPSLEDATSYLNDICQDKSTTPTADFDMVGAVILDGVRFTVTWTVDNSNVVIRESTQAGFYTIDLPEKNDAEFSFVLTATISDAEGNSADKSYTFTMPVVDNSGIVSDLKVGQAYNLTYYHGNNKATYYITGDMSGYYMAVTEDVNLAVNVYVEETEGGYHLYCISWGEKKYINMITTDTGYVNASFDDAASTVYTYDETLKTIVATVGTQPYMFGTKSTDGSTYSTIGPVVTVADKYFYATLAESTVPDQEASSLVTPEQIVNAAYELAEGEQLEGKFTLTGIIKSVDEAYSEQYKNITVTIIVGNMTDKPMVVYRVKGDGADQIGVGDEITVTGTIINYKGTIEFNSGCSLDSWVDYDESNVPVTPVDPNAPTYGVVDAPVAGTAYKFALFHGNENATVYFNGENYRTYSWYLAYSTNSADGVDVYLEAVDGVENGYRLYFMNGEAKTYIRTFPRDGDTTKGTLEMTTTLPEEYYTYNAEYKTLIYTSTTGEQFYLGSSGTYTSISVSAISYISNADSYVAHLYAEGASSETPDDGSTGGGETTDPVEMTIPEVLAAAEGTKVIVKGTVVGFYEMWSSFNNCSPYIEDADGNQLLVFRTSTKVGVGDVITVEGVVGAYNSVNQIAQGSTVTIDVAHVCSEFTNATCIAKATCVVCGVENGDFGSHSYDNGVCSVCGHKEGQAEVETITASKTMAELITSEGWTSSTTKQEFALDDVVSVKVNGGSNTGKAYNGDHIRIYATDTPAGTLTITLAEGYELVSVKVSTVTGTYAFLCVDGTSTDICNTVTAVSGSSVVLNSVKNGSDGKQVRVTAIEVVYKAAN